MKIVTIHYSNRDKGQKIVVHSDLDYQFAKLNFGSVVKIIRRY